MPATTTATTTATTSIDYKRRLGTAGLIWSLYLGSAPVYWFPYVAPELLSIIKHLGIYAAVGVTAVVALTARRVVLPWGLAGLAGFLIVAVASAPAIIASEFQIALYRMTDLAYAATAFTSFFVLANTGYDIAKIMKLSALVVAAFCGMTLLSLVSPSYLWHQPPALGPFNVSEAGFGGLRTGWSNGVALYVPFAFMWCLKRGGGISAVGTVIGILIFLAIISSQYMVGGRAGLLASAVSMVILSHYVIPAGKRVVGYVAIGLILTLMVGPAVYQHLRLDRLLQAQNTMGLETLDYFSANRITSYIFAVEKIAERPLAGHGFGKVSMGDHEIHNVWLKHGAEGGLLLLASELLLLFKILFPMPMKGRPSRKARRRVHVDRGYVYFWAALLGGFLISMLEPGMLFGSFQVGAIWWCVAGASIVIRRYRYPA